MSNALGDLIAAEVARAESDYSGVRARALSIVALTGGLVTLFAGLLTIAASSKHDILQTDGRWVLLVTLAAYVLSAVAALVVNVPSNVESPKPADLMRFVEDNWDDEGWDKTRR